MLYELYIVHRFSSCNVGTTCTDVGQEDFLKPSHVVVDGAMEGYSSLNNVSWVYYWRGIWEGMGQLSNHMGFPQVLLRTFWPNNSNPAKIWAIKVLKLLIASFLWSC